MKNLISYAKNLIAASFILSASASFADTTLFEVTNKKGESLYLGGTIHLLRASDFPLPIEFQQAFDKSQILVLETDVQKAQEPQNGQKMLQQMSYSAGKNLSTELRPDVWKELQDYSTVNQLPIAQIMQFEPFMASIVVIMQKSQKMGLTPGVDFYFNQQARTQNKSIGELESFDESLMFMDELNALDPNLIIKSTLRDVNKMEAMMLTATSSWKTGDLTTLEDQLAAPIRKEFPEMYRIIATDRNNKWMKKIEAMFATPEKEMILVGSLHLVGDEGLLNQLKSKGYKITAVKAAK